MNNLLPLLNVPLMPDEWAQAENLLNWAWDEVPALPPFQVWDGGATSQHPTSARLCEARGALCARFDCADLDIWGTYTRRDDPIYDEEVVELFIGPGDADPIDYYEFEISPNGVLFDASVRNPHNDRRSMTVDPAWDAPGIRWQASRNDAARRWSAALVIPWAGLTTEAARPASWRANLYRIERPRDSVPEYSAWSPTLTPEPDFHKPSRFGRLKFRA